jgi:hypothetical protein
MKYNKIIKETLQRSTLLVMALVLFSAHGIAVAQSFTNADLKSITSGTPWYDPLDGCGQNPDVEGGDITVNEGSSNIETAYNFFTDKTGPGLSTMQAAAIIGNMEQESGPGLRPKAVNSSSGATGIAQWLGGRLNNLKKYAADHNGDYWDIKVQLSFLWYEVTQGSEKVFGAVAALKGASNIQDAVTQWELKFERAGVAEANIPQRVTYANAVIKRVEAGKLGTGVITSPSETAGTGSTDISGAAAGSSNCGSGTTGAMNAQYIDGFTIYNQCDKAWGALPYGSTGKTICSSACGPTAMAMIITAFTKQRVTPDKTVAYANSIGMYVPGSGSSWLVAPKLAEKWGLKSKKIKRSIAAVNDVLKNGGLVIMSGTGDKPFTSKGHYIVIRAVTADGKWKIADSAHSDTSAKEWDPNFIIGIATEGGMYGIYAGSVSI